MSNLQPSHYKQLKLSACKTVNVFDLHHYTLRQCTYIFVPAISKYVFKIKYLKKLVKIGGIQCLRRREEVGRCSKMCSFLSTFRVKFVYVEVGRWSKMDQILST